MIERLIERLLERLVIEKEKRPMLEIQDMVKLSYQAALGIEHLIEESSNFHNSLLDEMLEVSRLPQNDSLEFLEIITLHQPIARLNLAQAIKKGMSAADIYPLCFETAVNFKKLRRTDFKELMDELPEHLKKSPFLFEPEKIADFFDTYAAKDYPPLHHSRAYRHAYRPSYRLVNPSLIDKTIKTS